MQTRKIASAIALVITLAVASIGLSPTALAQQPQRNYWAVIAACAATDWHPVDYTASKDAYLMYHVFSEHHKFDGIYYLDRNMLFPEVNASATRNNFRWAITNWLHDRSDANDIIFIFIVGHGGGYNTIENRIEGGRIDGSQGDPVDEGPEHRANTQVRDSFGHTVQAGTWFGVDECIMFTDRWAWGGTNVEFYWDDEFAADLATLQYSRLIVLRVGCVGPENDTLSCFNGGLIDDLSAPNRIIISASNETTPAYADIDGDGFSEFTEAFADALHGEDTYFREDRTLSGVLQGGWIVNNGARVNADFNGDGFVSMWEAWQYAWDHDTARTQGYDYLGVHYTETPWFDDDGDGLPTYINGSDHLDPDQGILAMQTFLQPRNIYDVTGDGKVGVDDIVTVAQHFGSTPDNDPYWNPLYDVNDDYRVGVDDAVLVAQHFGEKEQSPPS